MQPIHRLVRVPRRYAGGGILGLLTFLLYIFGVLGLIGGPFNWSDTLTGSQVRVEVPLAMRAGPVLPRPSVGALREGVSVVIPPGGLAELTVMDPGPAARLLNGSGDAVASVAFGLGALLLVGVLSDIRVGAPFSRRNTRRLGLIALLIAIGGTGSQLLDLAATDAAVAAAGLAGPDSPFLTPDHAWHLPVMATLAVLALAEAFRVGARLSEEVEGLV